MDVVWEIDLEMMNVHVKNDSKLGRLTQLFKHRGRVTI